MFHKDASSLGRNNRTVPLRKSDRRRLRQAADDLLRRRTASDETIPAIDPTASSTPTADNNPDLLSLYLDLAFVRGVLVARPIHHDVLGKVTLYWRSPAENADDNDKNDGSDASNSILVKWPYRFTTQCIWIHVDPPPSGTMQQSQQPQEAPTVALLAVLSAFCPDAFQLPMVVIHSAVSKFLCRGAHLMRAGIVQIANVCRDNAAASNSNNTNKGNNSNIDNNNNKGISNKNTSTSNKTPNKPPIRLPIVGIQVLGNPQIMAIGQITAGTIPSTVGSAQKGVAAQVWTCYGDDLWNQQFPNSVAGQNANHHSAAASMVKDCVMNPYGGSFFDDGNYGNVGFLQGEIVRPVQRVSDDGSDEDDDYDNDEEEEEEDTQSDTVTETKSDPMNLNSRTITTNAEGDEEEQVMDAASPSTITAEFVELPTAENTASLSTQDVESSDGENTKDDDRRTPPTDINPYDVILHQSVCQALVNIQDKQLPMTTATFYAQYVIPNRPPDTTLQLSQTSYKKFSKYLVAQVERDLLHVGPDIKTKDPVAFLTKVNRRHEDLRQIRKTSSATSTDASKSKTKKLAVVDLFVIPHHWVKLMHLDIDQVKAVHAKSEERRGSGMLTMPEARAILDAYIANESLVDATRPDMIHLDGPLTDIVFPKSKKREDSTNVPDAPPPLQLTRKEVVERWTGNLEPAFALVEMPGSHIRRLGKGKPPEVSFEVSMRQGKKYITRLRGLEEYGVDATEFSKEVAKRFACAAAIDTEPKGGALKKGHVELVFQGHLVDELRALLLGDERLTSHGGARGSPYSLPSSAIRVTLKKGVAAKKKK